MNNSKKRHSGGAYRRFKTMCAAHAKPGKDRTAARKREKRATQRKGGKK